jgi:hypothetical protein
MVDYIGWGWDSVAGFCENCEELSVFIKIDKLFGQLRDCQRLKKCVQWESIGFVSSGGKNLL